MRRRAIVGTAVAAVLAATTGAGAVTAADDGDKNSELAEAQFRVYLLANTSLRPTDITCTLPPTQNSEGEMLCFALVGRDSIAAVATLVSPGVYAFTAIAKSDTIPTSEPSAAPLPAPAPNPAPNPTPNPAPSGPANHSAADQAVLDAVAILVGDSAPVGDQLMDNNDAISSVAPITFDELTATVSVTVTTTATEQGERDFAAFDVTNVLAFLWETDWPLRDPDATIQPRAEVIVDGEIYGTPYEIMVRVADYEISFAEWLSITTGQTTSGWQPTRETAADAAAGRIATPRRPEPPDRNLFA